MIATGPANAWFATTFDVCHSSSNLVAEVIPPPQTSFFSSVCDTTVYALGFNIRNYTIPLYNTTTHFALRTHLYVSAAKENHDRRVFDIHGFDYLDD
jgi:hypothetical protein